MARQAIVIGASGGIGQALAKALEARAFRVTRLSRARDGLDITDEGDVARVFGRLDVAPDLVFVASGILSARSGPEKSLRALSAGEMAQVFAVNAIGPALVLKHVKPLLPRDRRVVFAALSARVGSIGDNTLGGWYAYRASKATLNQVIKTASIELRRTHPHLICAALHPGTVATDFTRSYPQHETVTPQQAATNLLGVLDGLTPEDSGGFFDWAGKRVAW